MRGSVSGNEDVSMAARPNQIKVSEVMQVANSLTPCRRHGLVQSYAKDGPRRGGEANAAAKLL